MSVDEQPEREPDLIKPHAQPEQSFFDISGLMVDKPLPDPGHASDAHLLPADTHGALDPFSFEDGAFDPGFDDSFGSNPFSFDDFVNEDAVTLAVDQAAGAA